MLELITAISVWCGSNYFKGGAYGQTMNQITQCKQPILACVLKDAKPGDGKEFYEKQLIKCLEKK